MPFAKLDRDAIVEEAVALLRREGLAAVSLRAIAARLGVSVSSLYWHVKDKETLHALMSASIFRACLDAVPQATSWPQWLHDFGLVLWEAQTSIADARQLIAITRAREGIGEDALKRILATLQPLGLPEAEAVIAQRAVQALVTGWTALRSVRPAAAAADRESFVRALDVLIAGWRAELARQGEAADTPKSPARD
mgnify:CR=1 FL=1|jgi:Transcriptional regulator